MHVTQTLSIVPVAYTVSQPAKLCCGDRNHVTKSINKPLYDVRIKILRLQLRKGANAVRSFSWSSSQPLFKVINICKSHHLPRALPFNMAHACLSVKEGTSLSNPL